MSIKEKETMGEIVDLPRFSTGLSSSTLLPSIPKTHGKSAFVCVT